MVWSHCNPEAFFAYSLADSSRSIGDSGFSVATKAMGRLGNQTSTDQCKRCDGKFGIDHDPLDKDPKALLPRRSSGAVICKPCFSFVQNHPDYRELKDGKIQEMLNDPATKASYLEKRAAYCEQRASGKRRKRGAGNLNSHWWLWCFFCVVEWLFVWNLLNQRDFWDLHCFLPIVLCLICSHQSRIN